MKLITLYKDPKKRWLQRVEIAVLVLVLPLALVWGTRTAQLWLQFREAEALYLQAELLLHQNRSDQAIPVLERSLAVYPEFLPAWQALGLACHMSGDHKKELETYRNAVATFPKEHVLQRDLATALHENDDHEAELEHLEIAAQLTITDEVFFSRLLKRARAEAAGTYPKKIPVVKGDPSSL